nr:hypothetical protein [Tanacetum cinerariifolium]
IPPEDDVFPAEEQPLPAAASPTTESPGYILKSDLDEDPKEDDDEDPEEDPADYPADHDDKEEEEEPSKDDADEEDEEQDEDDDDEEEHPALANSILPPPAFRLLSSDHREDRPEVTLPHRKRLSIVHCPGYEAGESSVAAAARPIEGRRADYGFVDSVEAEIRRRKAEDIRYGIRDTWIDLRDVVEEEALPTLEGVNTRVTKLATLQEQDTQDIYRVMEDTQGRQTEIFQRVEALKMAPKKAAQIRTTRLNPGATSNPNQAPSTTTTTVTNAQIHAMIDQGVNAALAARDANRTGDDSHTSGTGIRRTERWFEMMEMVFCISNYLAENQVKFATCTLVSGALTWWNSHVRIVGNDDAYVLTRIELKKKITDNNYLAENQVKFATCTLVAGALTWWNSHVRIVGNDDAYVLTRIELKKKMTDKRFEDTSRNNQGQQQPPKRQDVARAYAAGSGNRQQYAGSRPLCPKCNFNHDGLCTPRCYKCNKIGHLSRDCRSPTNANVANNQRGNGAGQKVMKNNNNNRGNQVGTRNAQARVYTVGNAGTNPDANTVTDHDYAVELADGRIVGINTVIRSCTLNFMNHPFNIDLMPVEMGSFEVIIGMDWLWRYHAVIVCADKIIRIPWGRETLIFHGDGSNQE